MTDLTTLENLKLDLGIEGTDEDAFLARSISIASAQVEQIVGYPIERASRSITLEETDRVRSIAVNALPLHDVTKLVVDGETWLDTGAAEPIDAETGFGFTAWGVIRAPYGKFFEGKVEITLESGYNLTTSRDLPLAFEHSVAEIVKVRRFMKDRDPSIVAESVPGVHSVTYAAQQSSDTVPAIVYDALAPYRAARVS